MKKIVLIPFGMIMFSCGGDEVVDNDVDLDSGNDTSIVEYDIDKNRVTAVELNNELTFMQQDMLDAVDILFQSDSANIESNYENAMFEAQINISELDELVFDGSEAEFKAAMSDLMSFYLTEFEEGFKDIIPLIKKSNLSADEDKRLKVYDEDFAFTEKDLFMKIFETQDEFAKANNIELVEK